MQNLREIRKAKNLSQQQLGKLIGVSQIVISQWENGRSNPRFSKLLKLCEALDCSIDQLAGKAG